MRVQNFIWVLSERYYFQFGALSSLLKFMIDTCMTKERIHTIWFNYTNKTVNDGHDTNVFCNPLDYVMKQVVDKGKNGF